MNTRKRLLDPPIHPALVALVLSAWVACALVVIGMAVTR